jgi:hypothetical protein
MARLFPCDERDGALLPVGILLTLDGCILFFSLAFIRFSCLLSFFLHVRTHVFHVAVHSRPKTSSSA